MYGKRKENLSFKTSECVKERLMAASKRLGMNLSNVCEAVISCLLSFVEGGVSKEERTFLADYWLSVGEVCGEGKRISTISLRIMPERKIKLMRLIEKMKNFKICDTTSSCLHELFRRSMSKREFMKLVLLIGGFTHDDGVESNEWWKESWIKEGEGERG